MYKNIFSQHLNLYNFQLIRYANKLSISIFMKNFTYLTIDMVLAYYVKV